MLHEASSIDSSRLLHLITLQRAEKRKKRSPRSLSPSRPGRHNVLLIFASNRHRRHFRSLPFEFDLFIPSVSPSPSCSQLGPRNQAADEHPQEATLGRCGVLPHFVQLFRPCVRRARTRSSRPPAKTTPAVRTPSSFQPCRPSFLLPFSAFFPASTGSSWGDAIRSGHRPNTRRKTASELKHESRHRNDHNPRNGAIRLASRERRWIPAGSAIRGPGAAECHFFADDRHRNRRRRRQRWAKDCKRRQKAERILSFRRGIASRDGTDRRIVPGANTTTPGALSEARELDREHQRLDDGTSTRELNEQKSRTLPHVARLLPPHELPEAASPARCCSPTNHEPTSGVVNAG